MAIAFSTEQGLSFPPHYLWTREKYEQATALGLLGPDDKVELIEGEIIEKMPQNNPHQSAIGAMQEALGQIFHAGHWVRIQLPLVVNERSMPEPNLAVVIGSWRDYVNGAPTADAARLVVEISDSTLGFDRTVKAGLYACAAIADYWIVNLVDHVLEVYRDPTRAAERRDASAYSQVLHLAADSTVSPLAAPQAVIAVADLLP